jgi:hypothetical protein
MGDHRDPHEFIAFPLGERRRAFVGKGDGAILMSEQVTVDGAEFFKDRSVR